MFIAGRGDRNKQHRARLEKGDITFEAGISAAVKRGRRPEKGDTVRRKNDQQIFVVDSVVEGCGITLLGFEGLFEATGFDVISTLKR